MHIVTCIYCKQKFDRDKKPFAQISQRRFAHKLCYEREVQEKEKREKDKIELEEYIKELLNEGFISPKVKKQINTYVNDYNFTYSGIKKTLIYFYDVKQNSKEKANGGIGIVPWVYDEAFNYYKSIWEANQASQGKNIVDFRPQEEIIKIHPPKRKIRKKKLFTFLDEDGDL